MKTMVVRVADEVEAEIAATARARKVSKSDIMRDRLTVTKPKRTPSFDDIAHLAGSVKGLPADLSANKKKYLRAGYGRKPYR
jgi:hypothetical protein